MAVAILTQKELKEHLHYNPETGIFTWIKKTSKKGHYLIGDIAGSYGGGGYIIIKIFMKRYVAHRLAWLYMYGKFPNKFIDHINRVKDDNRLINLREATPAQNQQNMLKKQPGISGIIGAKYEKIRNKYKADIILNGKSIFLGRFETAIEAHNAYIAAKRIYHPFSNL